MQPSFDSLADIRTFLNSRIADKSRDMNYETMISHVQGFEASPRDESLEAMILIGYLLQKDGRSTVTRLKELRSLRAESGETEAFLGFQDMCSKIIHPKVVTVHGYSWSIGTNKHDQITTGIEKIVDALAEIGFEIFINSGTLLGIIRDKAYIPYDDDIDFGVVLKATDPVSAAREWAGLKRSLKDAGIYREDGWSGGILKVHNIGAYTVDLFPAWFQEDALFVYPHTFGQLKREDLLPLGKSDISNLPIPRNPEAMLEINYGEDWRTPDPLFSFAWGPPISRFDTFLKSADKLLKEVI